MLGFAPFFGQRFEDCLTCRYNTVGIDDIVVDIDHVGFARPAILLDVREIIRLDLGDLLFVINIIYNDIVDVVAMTVVLDIYVHG